MATQTKTDPITESVETAAERVAELNEKAVANGKKAGAAYLSSYEKAVLSLADSTRRPPARRRSSGWRPWPRPRPTSRVTSPRPTPAPRASSSPSGAHGPRRSLSPRRGPQRSDLRRRLLRAVKAPYTSSSACR